MFEEDGKALLILELRQGGVTDRRVIDAMERIPRELFVPKALREQAYENIALPIGADELANCGPIYEEMPGWTESTVGVKNFDQLPKQAQNYLKRIESICEVPVDMISTGPGREETIVLRHPFD